MRIIVMTGSLLALAACGTPRMGQSSDVASTSFGQLPSPAGVESDGRYNYTLGPFDTVTVEVTGMPDLRREVRIDGEGMLSYPMAGAVPAAGLTTTQLAAALESRLRRAHMRDPLVSVNILDQESHVLAVTGEVEKPGVYPVTHEMTLLKAVATAGGQSDLARSSAVLVFREVAGQKYVGIYDLKAIGLGNYPDPRIYPGDTVSVSESDARRVLGTAQGLAQILLTPLIILLRQ